MSVQEKVQKCMCLIKGRNFEWEENNMRTITTDANTKTT